MSKTVLITGGATDIGKEITLQLATQRVNVVITGRRGRKSGAGDCCCRNG